MASLQQKIVAEDKAVESRTLEFLTEWERSKPIDGSTRPEDALTKLQGMEARYTRLKEERDNVAKAKEALELHDTGQITRFFLDFYQSHIHSSDTLIHLSIKFVSVVRFRRQNMYNSLVTNIQAC